MSPDQARWSSWRSQWTNGSQKGLAILQFCESIANHQTRSGRSFLSLSLALSLSRSVFLSLSPLCLCFSLSLAASLSLSLSLSALCWWRPARSGLAGGAELAVLAVWRIRGDSRENRAKLPLPDSRASTPEAATCPAENGDAEATILTGCADARPRSPKKEAGEAEGLEHLQIEDVQCQVSLHMAPPLASPAAREQLLDESEESEAIAERHSSSSSSHAWRRRDGWSCPRRPEPSGDGGSGWPFFAPFFHQEEQTEASSEADCVDYEPCSPRPGTRQGRRNKASRAASLSLEDEAETVKGPLGWADFVSHQSWDGSDSEEEQLFAQNTGISAQELLSLDDPEPELEGFVPRDLWVVFECDEEEELSDHQADEADEDVNSARASEPEVEPLERGCGCVGPRAFTLCDEEAMWTVGKASETDDTAETECMSSLAPTEFEKGVSDDDDDHNESEESLYGAQLETCAPRGGSPAEEILDGATRSKAELRGRCSGAISR
ncbi:unnamed protein product [Symbiodinium sp. CCMP2592]|nr:unnamed protein product [Symbiodinium sp. CCMP2592]